MKNDRLLGLILAAGAALGASSGALAQPYLVNGSGATLLRNLLLAPAITNDFIDVDGDGITTPIPDQLAPYDVTPPFPANQWFHVQYRSVGSVNGLQELIDWGTSFATGANGVEISSAVASEGAWNNRTFYVNAGVTQGDANNNNPGAAPVRSLTDGSYLVTTGNGPGTGIRIDFAPLDVPTSWGVFYDGEPNPKAIPGDPGYGASQILSVNKDGTLVNPPFGQQLADLGVLNTNVSAPDANTIFDTRVVFAPVAAMVNVGVGYREMRQTDIKWLQLTGRLQTGENLMAVTRDSGSGTRNSFQNALCLDPSWGAGENIGGLAVSSALDLLGPNFIPSNKAGSSRVEGAVINHRLAIGHTGVERGVTGSGAWLSLNRAEVLGVIFDQSGGVAAARPHINNVLDNGPNGYRIGAPAVIAHIGDPLAEPAPFGDANGNPRMANQQAANFMLNLIRSIQAFKAIPTDVENVGSPGEYMASQYILNTATDFVQNGDNPCDWIPNPNLNQELQDITRSISVLNNSRLLNFTAATTGLVPTRTNLSLPAVYTDGVSNQGRYVNQDGSFLNYGTVLNARNRVSGDFNGDGVRSDADTQDLVNAWKFRNGMLAMWRPTEQVSIEIIGDFNGDGNFTAADVRYWADGLVLTGGAAGGASNVRPTGTLDRAKGFRLVDEAFGGNFFSTTLATGASYKTGDSRADVSGPAGLHTKGFQPIGHDGVIDAFDIDYICANFGDWTFQPDAARMDLSADMNGDLVVDIEDVRVVVEDILETQIGDVNLDGAVDESDLAIINANLNTPGGWARGDVNCDGVVNQADADIVNAFLCPFDLSGNGVVDFADLNILLNNFNQMGSNLPGDFNGDGAVNFADLNALLGVYNQPC
ncbi:MAG: hypothetical protein IBJ10_07665 [Phycisphaerales bacterium]|nr:hypothetical protein [Phycisphaerales bacterium]